MKNSSLLVGLLGFGVVIVALALQPIPAAGDEAADNYSTFCAKCHGPQGHGDGPAAATLNKKPRDLTNCADTQKLSDDTMFKVIKEGGAAGNLSPEMPAWKAGLEDKDIQDLVKYIRALCKK